MAIHEKKISLLCILVPDYATGALYILRAAGACLRYSHTKLVLRNRSAYGIGVFADMMMILPLHF